MHLHPRRFTLLVALALGASLAFPASAGAATKACKLLKRAEIAKTFDQKVSRPERGIVRQVGSDCKWDVTESDTKPDGLVATFVQTVGAKTAYETNLDEYGKEGLVEGVSGLGKAFYQTSGAGDGVVWVLKGKVLLTVQGAFFSIGEGPQADHVELKEELVDLAKIAKKRL